MVTRAEHLEWCKERALQYVAAGDLSKHPETEDHLGIVLGLQLMMTGKISSPEGMRDFINGFK
jgi:hypothetical protein